MTSGTNYTTGSITINAGIYLCYVTISGLYPGPGGTTFEGCEVFFNGSNFTNISMRDTFTRIVSYGNGNTYGLYNGFISPLTVTSSTSITCTYKPYFTYTTSAVGIDGPSSNVSFIRIA